MPDFLSARSRGTRLTVLTSYDYAFARLLDDAGVDAMLVGDSIGMVVQGHETTLPVTLDEMIYHAAMVGAGRAGLVIADMPFPMNFSSDPTQARWKAPGRILKETRATQ